MQSYIERTIVSRAIKNSIGYWTNRGNDITLFNLPKQVIPRGTMFRYTTLEWHSPSPVPVKDMFFEIIIKACDECKSQNQTIFNNYIERCMTNKCFITYKFFLLQSSNFVYK